MQLPPQNGFNTACTQFWKLARACILFLVSIASFAQEPSRNVVTVYFNQNRTVPVEHVLRILVFNEDICSTKITSTGIEFFGLKRGESVVFIWTGDETRVAYLIRVVPAPEQVVAPKLRNQTDGIGAHGYISSAVQSLSGNGSPAGQVIFSRAEWEQGDKNGKLSIRAQGEDSTIGGSPLFNLNTATIRYQTPGARLTLLDSVFDVNGGSEAQIIPSASYGALTFRGVDLLFSGSKSSLDLFGGTSLPSYFLSSAGTKDVAGVNFSRKLHSNVTLFSTTAFTNVPVLNSTSPPSRRSDFFETLGLSSRINSRWAMEADGGLSTAGGHGQAGIGYSRFGRSAYLSASSSSSNFPLIQLQLLPTSFSLSSGITQSFGTKVVGSIAYQRLKGQTDFLSNTRSSTDYLNPSLSFLITPRERLTLNYAYVRNSSTLRSGRSNSQRGEFVLSSQLSSWLNNTFQVSSGALVSPLQINAQSQLSIRDSMNFRVHNHTFNLNASHDRFDPSLANRVNQQLQLLPEPLRNLFLLDPVGFLASGNLSPELRALLLGIQPSNTQVSLSTQFLIGSRVNFSPTVGYYHQDQGLAQKSNTQTLGYTLNWRLADTLLLQSSLSNLFLWDSSLGALRRTTVFSVGLTKSFSGAPAIELFHVAQKPTIRGLVFRDMNVNGAFNPGEPGLSNILVKLEDGRSTLTDENGRFEFSGSRHRRYKVNIELAQFRNPVRVTTPITAEAFPDGNAEIQFGIVDFSRVIGTVFNDYLSNLKKQPDALGMKEIELTLRGNSTNWNGKSDSSGEFEFNNVRTGIYELSINRSTLPPGFVIPTSNLRVEVGPTQTVVADIPLRALHSVSGRVVFRPRPSAEPVTNSRAKNATQKAPVLEAEPIPLKDVTLEIGTITAKTDADGNFILRELPGGPLLLTLVPQVAVADSVKLPSWPITLPHEPFKAEGVNITISNPELLQYLLPKEALQSLNLPKVRPDGNPLKASANGHTNTKPKVQPQKPIRAAIAAAPMPIHKADSAIPNQTAGSDNVDKQPPVPTPSGHVVIPTVNHDHLIDCVQTVARNRNGHQVLVCSDVISTR